MTAVRSIRLRVMPRLIPINGKNVELQSTASYIQWRNVGDAAWQNLVALSAITGPQGPTGPAGADGSGVPPGGTTGQVLAKTSNANYAVGWSNAGIGDMLRANSLGDVADRYASLTNLGTSSTFDTLAAAQAFAMYATAPTTITLRGYYAAGDVDRIFQFNKVASQPSHAGWFSMNLFGGSTAYYELAVLIPSTAMFGAKRDGATDDTSKIVAMFDFVKLKSLGNCVVSPGTSAVTMVEIEKLNDMQIWWEGYLYGIASVATDAVFRLKNSTAVRLNRPKVTTNKNLNYGRGYRFDTDIAVGQPWSGCSKITVFEPVATQVACAMTWGNTTYPDALYSENVVIGGWWYEVQSGVEVFGSQAFVSLIGLQNICGSTTGSAGWLAIIPIAVRSIGSKVGSTNCEHLLVSRIDGAVFVMEPIASASYGNPYGQIYSNDDACETGSPMLKVRNPAALSTPTSTTSRFQMKGHHGYHSQNLAEFLQVSDNTYAGYLHIGPGNSYGSAPRTFANIYSTSPLCHIYQDDAAFGYGFKKGLGAISGGIVHFAKRDIMFMYDTGDQVLAAGVEAKVGFINRLTSDDYERFYGNFSAGVFTIPQALKDVEVSYSMQMSPFNYDVSFYVKVGSDAFPVAGKSTTTVYCGGTVKIGDVPSGTAIQLQAVSSAGATTISQYDRLIISARN